MRKVLVVIGSRANYGSIKSCLTAINEHSDLQLILVVGGSAVLDKFGNVSENIINDGFPDEIIKDSRCKSWSVIDSFPSIRNITPSEVLIAFIDFCEEKISFFIFIFPFFLSPAVSVISINSFLKFISSEIDSIVVPAIFETIVLSSFTILLIHW